MHITEQPIGMMVMMLRKEERVLRMPASSYRVAQAEEYLDRLQPL